MKFDFNKFQTFHRYTKVLHRKEMYTHLYMPWSEEIDSEFMYKVKAAIKERGYCLIPLMDQNEGRTKVDDDDLAKIRKQTTEGIVETHLVMYNGKVIHILNVESILESEKSPSAEVLPFFSSNVQFSQWVKVTDLYVLGVDYMGISSDLNKKLFEFMNNDQQHFLFPLRQNIGSKDQEKRWIGSDRQVTYDYFMRSCELEEMIYPNCWSDISRKAQHFLISGEQIRKESISLRNAQKWEALKESFTLYKEAIIWELNEIYVFPIVDLLSHNANFVSVWEEFCEFSSGQQEFTKTIGSLVRGELDYINDFGKINYLIENFKAAIFSLKNKVNKKLYNEEFLIIEQFLIKHETKIESFKYKNIKNNVSTIQRIENWVSEVSKTIITYDANSIKSCNLKLTHLLSLMNSSSEKNNMLFSLMEEKMGKTCVSPDLMEEVKTLFSEISIAA